MTLVRLWSCVLFLVVLESMRIGSNHSVKAVAAFGGAYRCRVQHANQQIIHHTFKRRRKSAVLPYHEASSLWATKKQNSQGVEAAGTTTKLKTSNNSKSKRRRNKNKSNSVRKKKKGHKRGGSSSSTTTKMSSAGTQGKKLGGKKNVDVDFEAQLRHMQEQDRQGIRLSQSYCDQILAACVASNAWDSVLEVLDVMSSQNYTQRPSTYQACLQACYDAHNAESATEMLRAMKHAGVVVRGEDVGLVVQTLCGGGAGGRKEDGEGEGRNMWRRGLALLRSHAASLSTGSVAQNDNHQDVTSTGSNAKTTTTATTTTTTAPTLVTTMAPLEAYDAVLSGMAKEAKWKDALRLLDVMHRGRAYHKQAPLHHSHDGVGAGSGGEEGVVVHPKPGLSTYHAVLDACVAAAQAEQAVQLLLGMTDKGVMPNVHSYNLVIAACLKKQHWRRAMQLLNSMDDSTTSSPKIIPTTVTYNSVISACAKAGEAVPAMQLLTKMHKRGIPPDVVTYNAVMSACAARGRWKDALRLLEQCEYEADAAARRGGSGSGSGGGGSGKSEVTSVVKPDIITYTCAMRACARGRKTSKALELLQVARERGLQPDVYAYTSVIDACSKAGMWRKALDLLDEMRHEEGLEPNGVTYSAAIAACGNGGKWERALELLYQMRERNIKINVITYNAAITALAKASRLELRNQNKSSFSPPPSSPKPQRGLAAAANKKPTSKKFFNNNENDSNKDNNNHRTNQNLWKRALNLLTQMENEGLEPDAYSYSSAISACGAAGRWKEALQLISIMQAGGPKVRPNRIAYTSAMSACGRSGEWEHAVKLFEDMKNDGLQPDRVSYNALVSALKVANLPEKVLEVWDEMCGKDRTTNDTPSTSNNTNTKTPPKKKLAVATADSRSIAPDIITVTDVIACLDHSDSGTWREQTDAVFNEAVKRGILLRTGGDSLDSMWEVNLSCLSFPVARAACRYIFRRILDAVRRDDKEKEKMDLSKVQEVTLITGAGAMQRAYLHEMALKSGKEDEDDDGTPSTALREFVRERLRRDFDPPLYNNVPNHAQGTVVVSRRMVVKWVEANLEKP